MREEELLKRLDEWFKCSHLGSSEYFTYNELLRAKEQIRQHIQAYKGWLPTSKNINALPEPIRKYIHDIETNCSPANMVQENTLLKDTCEQLEKKLEMSSNRIKVLKRIIDTPKAKGKEVDVEEIIQAVLGHVICYHQITRDEDGIHHTSEYDVSKDSCHEAVKKVLGVEK